MMTRRPGFSLFEVMIAMAICVAGLVLILQMLGMTETLSRRAELQLQSQQHCRSLLNRFLAGISEPAEIRREELPADSAFWYSVKLDKHPFLPLENIIVDVWAKSPGDRQVGREDASGIEGETSRSGEKRFRLVGSRIIVSGFNENFGDHSRLSGEGFGREGEMPSPEIIQ